MRTTWTRGMLAVGVAGAVLLAACGGDDSSKAATTTGASGATTTSATGGSGTSGAGVTLKGVCPDTVVVQTDWNPESEHGAMYQMVGPNPKVDSNKKTVTGPLMASGKDTGVKIQVRVGGPAIGFQPVVAQMYQDPDILLGYMLTDEAVENYAEKPTKAIVAPLEINPQIIMWDPGTYPDVKRIADLKAKGAKIRYFESGTYMDYLVGAGIVDKGQLDASYDGTPAVFVSQQGKIAQQGFASAEPYIYKNEVKEWGKDVAFQLIHDTGWQPYAAPLAVRSADFEKNKPCFKLLVPIVQQAQVDYIHAPDTANKLMLDLIKQYNTGWVYSEGVAKFSVEQQLKLKLVSNGPNDTLGDFDLARVTDFIAKANPIFDKLGKKTTKDLKASDIVTNEFIDPKIKL